MRQTLRFLSCLLPFLTVVDADEREPEIELLQAGVSLTEIASHPEIVTPTGIDVDDDGRIWTVISHTHAPPEDYEGPKFDEIRIFREDGTSELFHDQTHHTMDLELGADGWVYLAERGRILRIKDSDGDGRADTEETIARLDTEGDYPHNGLSGLAWHPSGDLIFALGENFAEPWTLTSDEGNSFSGRGEGGVFRCRPDGRGLDRLARGMWNPFGVVARSDGEIFAVENDPGERPPCRLLHVVPGADFGYQRAYGADAHHPFVAWNGELRGTLPMVHPVGEAPCGALELGRGLLVPSWSDHRLDFMPLVPSGASYTASRIQLIGGSRYFRPVGIAEDPRSRNASKRAWFLTDWVDGRYPVHGYGRLWKLEIDLDEASGWIGPLDALPDPTKEAELAAELRSGGGDRSTDELLTLAQSSDLHLASAALEALSERVENWDAKQFARRDDGARPFAAIAVKLSGADPDVWIPALLDDPHKDVRFEGLRWVSDDQLEAFLPTIETLLGNNDIEFSEFEAAAAARNSLLGTPDLGVRDPDMLLSKVIDDNAPPAVRAHALRLLPTIPRLPKKGEALPELRFPKGLTAEILGDLLDAGDPALSLEAVHALAGAPSLGQDHLARVAADDSRAVDLRAEAIAGLAPVHDEHRDLLLRLANAGNATLREEALRCFRGTNLKDEDLKNALRDIAEKHPDSKEAVDALLEPATLMVDRPALADTEAWLTRLASVPSPPDPENGRRIFHHRTVALCANCHRHDGRGTKVGPDLTLVHARDDREWLLRSLLDPNAEIAPEYLPRSVVLRDGSQHVGIRLRSSTSEVIRDLNGQNRSFKRDDIASMEELSVSLMPTGLPYTLTDRELRDLMAFLSSD
ncbi:MAG: PVC-type heme-binding CxxCH protein [Verrucomicrobiales bacterium]